MAFFFDYVAKKARFLLWTALCVSRETVLYDAGYERQQYIA